MDEEEKKTALLELVRSFGRLNLDTAAEKLNVDKKTIYVWSEQFKKQGILYIEPHFLKAPDIVAADKLSKAIKKKAPEKDLPKKKGEKEKKPLKDTGQEIEKYNIKVGETEIPIKITNTGDYVYHYEIEFPHIDFVTRALLDETKRSLVGEIQIETHTILDAEKFNLIKTKFLKRAKEKLGAALKEASEDKVNILSRILVNEMIGLGDLEYLLADDFLEEVVVNNSRESVWIYHKNHGWIKTNLVIPTEDMVHNYSSRIAREVGREITHLEPLLDAHLASGDRVNATLFPISTAGNTITIRRFSRVPWTMVHMIDPKTKTLSVDAAAFLWLAVEFEFSILVAGGTASGKTTLLNALMPFMPANQRILSMEDTRELNLPGYLHWIPLTIRHPNPHGEGEISLLDLIQNSLRMRPDRIIVGEVRRKRETEVLFEAMHTGHSVYGTFHAEQAYEVIDRITNPPMNIPGTVLGSLHLVVVQYRNRRTGIRRTFEISELTKGADNPDLNTVFRWNPHSDDVESVYPSIRIKEELELFAGMTEKDVLENLAGKKKVLEYLLKKNIKEVDEVGMVVTKYYMNKEDVIDKVEKGKDIKIEKSKVKPSNNVAV